MKIKFAYLIIKVNRTHVHSFLLLKKKINYKMHLVEMLRDRSSMTNKFHCRFRVLKHKTYTTNNLIISQKEKCFLREL